MLKHQSLEGGTGNDILCGGTGNDTIYGDQGHDDLRGGPGGDIIYPGAGNDIARAGANMDNVHYNYDLNVGATDYYHGGLGYDVFTLYLPSDMALVATEIEALFNTSPGLFDLNPWGMDLVVESFEEILIDLLPGSGKPGGETSDDDEAPDEPGEEKSEG